MFSSTNLKSWIRRIACLAVFAFMTTSGSSLYAAFCDTGVNSGNLIGNCGFENSTSGLQLWTVSGSANPSTTSPLAPNGDTQYAQLVVATGNTASIRQNMTLLSGVTYNVSFQYLTTSISGASFDIRDSTNAFVISPIVLSPTGASTWGVQTAQFTAGSNSPYTLFIGITSLGGTQILRVDNVIVTAVPEPASMLLLGSLCSAIAGYKYRRKNSC